MRAFQEGDSWTTLEVRVLDGLKISETVRTTEVVATTFQGERRLAFKEGDRLTVFEQRGGLVQLGYLEPDGREVPFRTTFFPPQMVSGETVWQSRSSLNLDTWNRVAAKETVRAADREFHGYRYSISGVHAAPQVPAAAGTGWLVPSLGLTVRSVVTSLTRSGQVLTVTEEVIEANMHKGQ
jgi:hypothetical protein